MSTCFRTSLDKVSDPLEHAASFVIVVVSAAAIPTVKTSAKGSKSIFFLFGE